MKQGEWISDNGETLVSAGGMFEFGFFSPTGSSGKSLGQGLVNCRGSYFPFRNFVGLKFNWYFVYRNLIIIIFVDFKI